MPSPGDLYSAMPSNNFLGKYAYQPTLKGWGDMTRNGFKHLAAYRRILADTSGYDTSGIEQSNRGRRMIMRIKEHLASLRRDVRGSALIIVGLGMPALIGVTGFGIDTAQWYMWKRELQHSVDQAAIGGAFAIAKSEEFTSYQQRAVQEFNANQGLTTSFATEPRISLADYAGGTDNSVLVSASATKRLPFSNLLTGKATTVSVSAQAAFQEGSAYSACLISLAKTGIGTDIGGSADIKARCGLAALSCDENAIEIDGSATVQTDSIVACGTVSVPEANQDVVTEGAQSLKDIFAGLETPDNPIPQDDNCKDFGTGAQKSKLAALKPGTYDSLVVKCTTTLSPGIYVIDGGTLDLSANYNVTGNNVMFVLKNGATMKMGGSGNNNSINLTPMQTADFASTPYYADADAYSGMLVFEDRDSNPGSPGHIFNGNSNSLIEGSIYLPSGELTVNGTANVSSQCLMISAYRIHIKGGANLETLCPSTAIEVGNTSPIVRLIA